MSDIAAIPSVADETSAPAPVPPPLSPPHVRPSPHLRPWGFWSTLAWALAAVAVGALAFLGGVVWLSPAGAVAIPDDRWLPSLLIVMNIAQVAVLAGAAWLARWPVGQYLGL